MPVLLGVIALGIGLGVSVFTPVPQSLKTTFDEGQSLYALQEYEGAIKEYDKIVKFKSKAVRADSVIVQIGDELQLPVIAASWYQLGNAYKRSGKHDKAIDSFREVLSVKGVPEDFRSLVQFQMAETRFLEKEYGEAVKEYKHYVELFPNSDVAGKAFFYSGWSEFNRKEYDRAISTLEDMLATYPQDKFAPEAQFRIASAYFEKGDYENAVAEAQKVLDRYPHSAMIAQAVYLQANCYDKTGRNDEAIEAYRGVRNLYDKMYELLRGSFREGKNVDFDNYRELFETSSLRVAEIYRKDNKFDEAYKELIAAQETADERDYKAKVQMRIGDNYMEWKRFDDAWTSYNQVIELYADTPYPATAQYYKGEAYYFGGKYADARAEYLKVPQNYPDSETGLRAAALYSAAWTSEKVKDPEEALKLYRQVFENFPRSEQAPLCLLRIARINQEMQRPDEAVEAYKIIAENYGDTRHAADANYGLGLLYRDAGEPDKAVAAFSRVRRDAREIYVASLIEAANIHLKEGHPDKGREALNELLEGVTGDHALEAKAYYQIAQLDLNNKSYVDALRGFTKVIDEYGDSDVLRDAYYGRALSYHYVGRYNKALGDYQWLLGEDLPESLHLRVNFSMALSYAAAGEDGKARKLLEEVIASGDENLMRSARLQLISMAEKQDPRDALRIYEELLASASSEEDKARVLTRLASAYFRLQQYDRSIETSQQLIDLALNVESVSNALFLQANSYFRSGKYEQSIVIYRKIVENYPQVAWAKNSRFQIAVAYNKLASGGNLNALPLMSKAFEEYYTAYPEDPQAELAYYYDAWAYYRMGKWSKASEVFDELADKYPKSKYAPEALFRAGEAIYNLAQRGTYEEKQQIYAQALEQYDKVVKRYPRSNYTDDALYNKAWALISMEHKEEALPIFEQIVAEHPDGRYGPQSQFTLGDYYYGEKIYDKAAENYQKFLDLFPEERLAKRKDSRKAMGLRRKAHVLLGHLGEIEAYGLYAQGDELFSQKKYPEARKIFEQVRQKYPGTDQAVNASVNIGAAYFAEEEYRKAGQEFKQVVDKFADNPKYSAQVNFARSQLKSLKEGGVL